MHNMGGLRKQIPLTFWVYLIGALALAGIPPLAGFFSKDEILAEAIHLNPFVWLLLTAAAFLTAFYMGRQVFLVFFGRPRTEPAKKAIESPLVMTLPLIILAALSVFGGLLNFPGLHSFTTWLGHTLGEAMAEPVDFNFGVGLLSTALALVAIYIAWTIYGRKPLAEGEPDPLKGRLGWLFTAFENKWWVDEIYDRLFIQPYRRFAAFLADKVDWKFWHDWFHDTLLARGFRAFARFLAEPFDLGVIDGIANGLAKLANGLARLFSFFQTGFVRNYALVTFFGVVLIMGYLVFSH